MRKIAYIFPGQASQYTGMGKDVYENYTEARAIFDDVSEAIGIDLKDICFNNPEGKLGLTTYTQPAIFTTSLALWACIGRPKGIFLAGHSLGEFTTFVAGGAIDLRDGARLVRDRGRFMEEATPPDIGSMAAIIGLDSQKVEVLCKEAWDTGRVWPANYNCPGQVIITGEKKGVLLAMELSKQSGAKRTLVLPVSIPAHCPLMDGAAKKLKEEIRQLKINDLDIPVVSNCWAIPIKDKDKIKENMVKQMTSPVYWEKSVRLMIKEGVTTFVEVGPGKILSGLIKRIDKEVEALNISDVISLERLKETLI